MIGGTEQDDVSKVTVTDANGNIVPADISIDDSIDGKRVVKAHATAPHSGLYTLNVPQSAKPTGGDYEINDGSVACWNGDNGTGSLADCQTGNSDSVGKVTPTPDKVWVLDESGALVAEDRKWTNQQGVDQKTFLVGDQVGVVVNGSIPAHLLNPLASYSITDDLTGSNQWIDWKSGKVFVDGKDETANFTIAIDRKAGTATATAKSAYIAKTMFRNSASKVRFYLTGTIKKGATEGKKIQLTNKAYEKWNNETRPTNEPPVFVWTPNPNKAWAMKVDGKWQLTVDPTKSDKVGGDDKYYRLGDEVAAVVSGTLPTGLGRVPEIAWADDFANVDSILDLKDTSNIKVYEQDTADEANASVNDLNKTGRDVTDQFDITAEGTKVTVSAKDSYEAAQKDLKTAKQISVVIPFDVNFDTVKLLESYGKSEGDELNTCVDPKGDDLDNKGGQTVGGSTVDTNTPKICVTVPPIHKQVIAESLPGRRPVQHRHQDRVPRPDRGIHRARGPADPCGPGIFGDRHQAERHLFRVHHREQADPGDHRPGNRRHHPEERLQGAVGRSQPLVRGHVRQGLGCRQLEGRLQPARAAALRGQGERGRADRQDRRQQGRADRQQRRHPVQQGRERAAGHQAFQAGHAEGPDHQHRRQDRAAGRQGVLPRQHRRLQAHRHRLQGMALGHDGRLRPGVPDPRREARGDPDETGRDRTGEFNIQDKDGVLYAFAKTVDTQIPVTGETVPGDPQPGDLKAYSEKSDKDYDPLKDPSIDQSLLGHTYQVVMPMTVTKVKDGHTVENTATQVTNDKRDKTNTVTNPLKEINPKKDVTVQVGGDSIDGKSVYLNHTFLYRLDSSILPPDRAYQTVTDWGGTDQLATEYDQYLGNWAVYASRDLYRDGQVLAARGEKIAGSGFDSSKFGGNLFAVDADGNGKVTVNATQAYLDLVSADNEHEAGWVLYLQCKRIAVADEVPNTWTETINGQPRESNKVVTKTPDMTPSIHLEKVDAPDPQAGRPGAGGPRRPEAGAEDGRRQHRHHVHHHEHLQDRPGHR